MTKPKDLEENKEKPFSDTSAQLTSVSALAKIDSMLRTNKTEEERTEVEN